MKDDDNIQVSKQSDDLFEARAGGYEVHPAFKSLNGAVRFTTFQSPEDDDYQVRDRVVERWGSPVVAPYSEIVERTLGAAYLYIWTTEDEEIEKLEFNPTFDLYYDPCAYFKRKFPTSWSLGPIKSLQLQHFPVEWLKALDGSVSYADFDHRMREYNFVGKACALHGLCVGDDSYFSHCGRDPIPFPEEIYIEDDDDVEGRIMNGIVRIGDGTTFGPTTEESLTFAQLIGVAPFELSENLNSSAHSADGFLDGALKPIKAAEHDFETLGRYHTHVAESSPADFAGETIGDGSPFYYTAQCKLAGAVATREVDWDIIAFVKPTRYWRLGVAIDQARYPLPRDIQFEGTSQFVTKGNRVECLANEAREHQRSVPGTYDRDVSRATYAAVHSGIRVYWNRKIDEIPDRWNLLPPLHHRADPRRAHLLLWGRQKEFLGKGDVPAYGRSKREHIRALHLEAAIMRIIALGVSGRIPLPRGEVIASVLGTSMYYERLRASGWWWYLPPAKGLTAELVVRIHDVDPDPDSFPLQTGGLIEDPYFLNTCVVDPGPERRIYVFESHNRPDFCEAFPIRFSELKWFFYIGFVIAARICDMPYCFSIDSGSGSSRIKVAPQSIDEARGGAGLVELEGSSFDMPEFKDHPFHPEGKGLIGSWLARDVQAYLGFEYEKRAIPGRRKATHHLKLIRGNCCGRHRVDSGYTIVPGRRKYYVPPLYDQDYAENGERDENPIASNGRLFQLQQARERSGGDSGDYVLSVPGGQMSSAEFTTIQQSIAWRFPLFFKGEQQSSPHGWVCRGDDVAPDGNGGKPR